MPRHAVYVNRDAQTGGHGNGLVAEFHWSSADFFPDPFGHDHAAFQIGVGQENAELFAPTASVPASAAPASNGVDKDWLSLLEKQADLLLQQKPGTVMDALTREFEGMLIRCALKQTRGRRIEAAQKLGIGRNTITRKIQELGLDAEDE